jgi:deoxycytidylate deaminase
MTFTLGSIIVKGGKVISTGYNHQRPHYDDANVKTCRKPVSMHAEMHAIFNVTGGKSPSLKQQVQSEQLSSSFTLKQTAEGRVPKDFAGSSRRLL